MIMAYPQGGFRPSQLVAFTNKRVRVRYTSGGHPAETTGKLTFVGVTSVTILSEAGPCVMPGIFTIQEVEILPPLQRRLPSMEQEPEEIDDDEDGNDDTT